METQASDPVVERRLRRIEGTIPYLFRHTQIKQSVLFFWLKGGDFCMAPP